MDRHVVQELALAHQVLYRERSSSRDCVRARRSLVFRHHIWDVSKESGARLPRVARWRETKPTYTVLAHTWNGSGTDAAGFLTGRHTWITVLEDTLYHPARITRAINQWWWAIAVEVNTGSALTATAPLVEIDRRVAYVGHDANQAMERAEIAEELGEQNSAALAEFARRLERLEQSNAALRNDNAVLRGQRPAEPPRAPRNRGPRYEPEADRPAQSG